MRDQIKLRMRLMPYFYSAFARYHFDGTPPFRAMALDLTAAEVARDPSLLSLDDQFMAGDSLLVAPRFAKQTAREVYLPAGAWFDFETGERLEGGRRVRVSPGLEIHPVKQQSIRVIRFTKRLRRKQRARALPT